MAIFLDRDGTLIEEVNHLQHLKDLQIYPKAPLALASVNRVNIPVVVVTNQSVVARGLLTEEDLKTIHDSLQKQLQYQGAQIDAFYYCPHHPRTGMGRYLRHCDCRKPKPGLLLRAANDLQIDLSSSYMIGDRLLDIEAGHRAGCTSILVETGYGKEELRMLNDVDLKDSDRALRTPDFIARDISYGMEWILEQRP